MSGMLAKVINSTVGTNNFKSLDEALYNRFKSDVRLVGADEVLYAYGGTWTDADDIPNTAHEGYITQGIKFDHNGTVIFKTTQVVPRNSTKTYAIVVQNNNGVTLKETRFEVGSEGDGSGEYYIDIATEFNVTAGTPYKIIIARETNKPERNLRVCALPVMWATDVTLA